MCVSPTMESVGLLLTGRDKVRIKEPFAFVQNSTLSKPVCVPHGHCTLGFWADTSAHALSALRGKGGSLTSAHVAQDTQAWWLGLSPKMPATANWQPDAHGDWLRSGPLFQVTVLSLSW